MDMFLTQEEIEMLTGFKKHKKQCQFLAAHHYEFDVRPDGSPIVLRTHIEKKLNGIVQSEQYRKEPNVKGLLKLQNATQATNS